MKKKTLLKGTIETCICAVSKSLDVQQLLPSLDDELNSVDAEEMIVYIQMNCCFNGQ
jgi:hypothetical protein